MEYFEQVLRGMLWFPQGGVVVGAGVMVLGSWLKDFVAVLLALGDSDKDNVEFVYFPDV
jgi:hypothetical protein